MENAQDSDPDYQLSKRVANSVKKEDNTVRKIKTIINNEFDKELLDRQNQIEHIETQICKVQKLLHLVRYAGIKSYYNRPELEYNQTDEEVKDFIELGGQKRIHPAVKKILNANSVLNITEHRSLRKAIRRRNVSPEATQLGNKPVDAKEKLCDTKTSTSSTQEENLQNDTKQMVNIQPQIYARRKRIKQSIIVGNISQWITPEIDEYPSGTTNNTSTWTHKWMAYVRGPKESPEVSSFIDKVIFYLHPSLKPQDVLEISKPPFHLKKMGWGEFPLRVKIHFKNTLNRPVDIIHHLKLPKEHPGKQVLANETVADIYLHEEIDSNTRYSTSRNSNASKRVKREPEEIQVDDGSIYDLCGAGDNVKKEEPAHTSFECDSDLRMTSDSIQMKGNSAYSTSFDNDSSLCTTDSAIKMEIDESASTSFEHDYCYADMELNLDLVKHDIFETVPGLDVNIVQQENQVEQMDTLHLDHCYSLPVGEKHSKLVTSVSNDALINIQDGNSSQADNLLYGLGDSYVSILGMKSGENSSGTTANDNMYSETKEIKNSYPSTSGNRSLLKTQKSVLKSTIHNIGTNYANSMSATNVKVKCSESKIQKTNKWQLTIAKDRYKNMGEVLPYLFRNMPLYEEKSQANKEIYYGVAKSFEEYCSWNIGKRLNSEWFRARRILRIVKALKIAGHETWNTRSLIMYGRSHGYTPVTSFNIYGLFRKMLPEIDLLTTCYAHNGSNVRKFSIDRLKVESDISVDVIADAESPQKKIPSSTLDISDKETKPQCSFIKQCALDCGIVLKPEEIIQGVIMNGAEKIILEAVKSLSDNLIRRAMNYVVCSHPLSDNKPTIQKEHIQMAIQERREIKAILEYSIVRKNKKFFS